MNDPSDESLVTASRNGDHTAFRELVERYESKVAGVVKSMLGETAEASDVGQEVFIRFYEALDRFKGESSVGTYLIRIAINLSLNEIKRKQRRRFFNISVDDVPHVAAVDESTDLREVIRYEVGRLDRDFQLVVTLRLMEGYSTEETAEILKVPLGTVLSRLSRAQKKLKNALINHLTR
jgi:RNA polymerase sigma-70 factor (ECF subfamily)